MRFRGTEQREKYISPGMTESISIIHSRVILVIIARDSSSVIYLFLSYSSSLSSRSLM